MSRFLSRLWQWLLLLAISLRDLLVAVFRGREKRRLGAPLMAQPRNPHFEAAERAFIKRNPLCVSCGQAATTAHHTKPYHLFPALEMNEALWAAVCPECHYVDGHARNWQKYVANFFELMEMKRKGIKE